MQQGPAACVARHAHLQMLMQSAAVLTLRAISALPQANSLAMLDHLGLHLGQTGAEVLSSVHLHNNATALHKPHVHIDSLCNHNAPMLQQLRTSQPSSSPVI
jgi:hypothetical protein